MSLVPILFLFLLVVFVVLVLVQLVLVLLGRDVQLDRRDRSDFEAAPALRAWNDVTLVYVVLVDIDVEVTLGARGHPHPPAQESPPVESVTILERGRCRCV
jgi:hypothetical protein